VSVTTNRRQISWDALAHRIRSREAGNLATSMLLGAALRVAPLDLAYRLAFGLVLNAFVYLVNDYYDVELDLLSPGRADARTRFLSEHRPVARAACFGLAVVLAVMGALHGGGLFVAFAATAVVILAYSAALKGRPFADVLAMGAWGLSMALVGFPLDSAAGWKFAGLLALLCMVTEVVQVIRDQPSDAAAGVQTTAVALGVGAAAFVAHALTVASAAYASLLLEWRVGPALLLALLVPLRAEQAARSWDALRLLFGLVWVAVLFGYFRSGRLGGWLS